MSTVRGPYVWYNDANCRAILLTIVISESLTSAKLIIAGSKSFLL